MTEEPLQRGQWGADKALERHGHRQIRGEKERNFACKEPHVMFVPEKVGKSAFALQFHSQKNKRK